MKIAELTVVQSTAKPHLNSLRGFHERSIKTVITSAGFEVGEACYLLDQEAFEKFIEVVEEDE